MITVRFPNGQAVQFNSATRVTYEDYGAVLTARNKKKWDWIATVLPGSGAIIEAVPPCRVYDGVNESRQRELADLTREIRSLKRKINSLAPKKRKTT